MSKIADEYLKIKVEMAGNPFIGFLLEQDREQREKVKKQATEIENLKRRVNFADGQLFNALRESNKLRDEKAELVEVLKEHDEKTKEIKATNENWWKLINKQDEEITELKRQLFEAHNAKEMPGSYPYNSILSALREIAETDISGKKSFMASKTMKELAQEVLKNV